MKRSKFVSVVRKIGVWLAVFACVFSAGYVFGAYKSYESKLAPFASSKVTGQAKKGEYTAVLSGKWIYFYDEMGALYDTVYVYTEYLTEEDKKALSNGIEFESAEQMRAFCESLK